MKEINPAFIQAAKAYHLTVEYCKETNKTIIRSAPTKYPFWWDSTESDDDFWREVKTYFYDQGYNTAARR